MLFKTLQRLTFSLNRLREKLWVRPLLICCLSLVAVFIARLAENTPLSQYAPDISLDSIETLLSIMAASMLVIATFAVSSMIAAYTAASDSATPRSFPLVVADDISQYALAGFVGAFIFSIVSLTAVKNNAFDDAGLFVLFILTIMVFAIVILTFVRWVDRIARLGRVGATIEKAEAATHESLRRRRLAPALYAKPVAQVRTDGIPLYAEKIGYVQHIDVDALNQWAEKHQASISLNALPGSFTAPGRALAYIHCAETEHEEPDTLCSAFTIGRSRLFDDDPRFGVIVLSEIASRALSPAVNDPGTAIDVIGTLVRLFIFWSEPLTEQETPEERFPHVEVTVLAYDDFFDDAFTSIARDGAGHLEVAIRLQKALAALASSTDTAMQAAAKRHALRALELSEQALQSSDDLNHLRAVASWTSQST